MTYHYHKTDGGRSLSKRPRQRNDCVVRAIAVACEVTYDEAYDILRGLGRRSCRSVKPDVWKTWMLKYQGSVFVNYPVIIGVPRMTLDFFCAQAKGRWVVHIARHLTAVVDGTLYDEIMPPGDRCVYTAFKVG